MMSKVVDSLKRLFTLTKKDESMNPYTRAKFKVKIRSLAEESRIIKKVARKHKGNYAYVAGHVMHHNRHVLSYEQRHTLLAYAFLRGKSYKSTETNSNKAVDVYAVERILRSIAEHKAIGTEVLDWVLAGDTPLGRQPAFNPAKAGSNPASP